MFYIGNILIKNPVIVAPMAGVSNIAFRKVVKRFNPGLIYTEMVSDKAVFFKNKKTLNMLKVDNDERPISLQIFGTDIDSFCYAAEYVNKNSNCDIIDINMGCPVPKITKNESGAKLLLDSNKIYRIIKEIVNTVDKPVTVKMRLGWNKENINILENSKAAEEAGAKCIAIHARTASDKYTPGTCWEYIELVKKNTKIPIIGNGDINTPEIAFKRLKETKCDGVMIGRACLGNPWILKQILDYLTTGNYEKKIKLDEKFKIIRNHLDNLVELKGNIGILEFRSHIYWYVKGLKNNISFKKKIQNIKDIDKMKDSLSEYYKFLLNEEDNNE